MRRVHALLAVVIGAALVAGATAYAGSGEATAQRQRIGIGMVVNDNTDTGTFTLYRLRANTPTDVTGEPLDSMGGPVRVDVNGRVVFICCKGCEKTLRKKPDEYLAKLPK